MPLIIIINIAGASPIYVIVLSSSWTSRSGKPQQDTACCTELWHWIMIHECVSHTSGAFQIYGSCVYCETLRYCTISVRKECWESCPWSKCSSLIGMCSVWLVKSPVDRVGVPDQSTYRLYISLITKVLFRELLVEMNRTCSRPRHGNQR